MVGANKVRSKRLTLGMLVLIGTGCSQDPASPLDRPDVLAIDSYDFVLNTGRVVPAELGRLWIPSGHRSTGVSLAFVRLATTAVEPARPTWRN